MGQSYTKGIPLDTDQTLSNDSDFVAPTQKATKTFVASGLATKQDLLGYTAENSSNKSSSYTSSSTTTYPNTKALVDGLATKQNTITGAATSITSSNLTASKAVVSDSSGKVATSSTTSTEIGYVAGVTSAIQTQLSTWKFPLVFLDFETINPVIPRYLGTGPYMHVPFQFSVHRMESKESEVSHFEFLHTNATDPRPTLIPALLKACEGEGSIVSYFGKFETDRIMDMAKVFPEFQTDLEQTAFWATLSI